MIMIPSTESMIESEGTFNWRVNNVFINCVNNGFVLKTTATKNALDWKIAIW